MCSRAPPTTSSSVVPRMTAPHSQVICFTISSSRRRFAVVVRPEGWVYVGAELAGAKVQLCGRFVVEVEGHRVEGDLAGRQGRLLVAYLVANRDRTVTREEVIEALWPGGRDGGLAPLLSKTRRVVPLEGLR